MNNKQKKSNSIIQSHVDYWHFQCQKYQFMVDIDRYGLEDAIRRREPPYIIRNGEKIYCGHLDKFKSRNLHYIKNYKLIIAEMQDMKDDSVPKYELKNAIKMLKNWKKKFYA